MREDDTDLGGEGVALGPNVSPNLSWLAGIVWGGLPGVGVSLGPAGPGRRDIERYVVVPNARSPRIILPAESKPAAAAARAASATRSLRSQAQRAAAAAVLRTPARRVVFRDILTIHVDASSEPPSMLAGVIGEVARKPVVLAISVRSPAPSRKPVAIAVGPAGSIEAFAKIAWNGPTDENVRAEAVALGGLAEHVTVLRAPVIKGQATWKERSVLITSPMPAGLRRYSADGAPPPFTVTRDVAGLFGPPDLHATFGPCRGRLAERFAVVERDAAHAEVADALGTLLQAAATRDADAIATGAWHGDWAPWNLGIRDERLWAWDWEYARPDVPLGLDLLHFVFQVSFVSHRRGLAASLDHARSETAEGLSALGWTERAQTLVHTFHLAELSLRMLEVAGAGVPPNPRYLAEAVPVLRAAADRLD